LYFTDWPSVQRLSDAAWGSKTALPRRPSRTRGIQLVRTLPCSYRKRLLVIVQREHN